jgi:hypothetical protein
MIGRQRTSVQELTSEVTERGRYIAQLEADNGTLMREVLRLRGVLEDSASGMVRPRTGSDHSTWTFSES